MKTLQTMIIRNMKMFFKDKGMFLTSLITPVILLVLYVTFLGNVYEDSFRSNLSEEITISNELIKGTVAAQLMSSILAVCTITVAFCSNLLMVQDKINRARTDFEITPVRKSTIALSYYVATFISTLIISFTAAFACFIYIAFAGWYFSITDVLLVLLDCVLLTMFGTALSSIVNVFLETNGQASAVGTIVSAGYGFLCGAYMPIASFGSGLQKFLGFLPGTYGTSLIKNHCLRGVYREMVNVGFPQKVIEKIKDGIDCNLYFFGTNVPLWAMYLIMILSICLLIGAYVLINILKTKKGK